MRAIVQTRYGPSGEVLQLREIDTPVPKDGEVLVRVHATSVNPADWHFARGEPKVMRLQLGLTPKITVLGCDVAGRVEAVGPGVTRFQPGDEVFGCPFMRGFGTFAEFVAIAEDLLAAKPPGLSFEHAAAVPMAAQTALQALRDHGSIAKGRRALVIGASGGVGTFAVQLAKLLGAEVTGVCSTRNVDLVRSLGADHVIDYTREDFVAGGQRYDLILQLAGTRSAWDCRRALTPKGTLILSSGDSSGTWVGPMGRVLGGLALSPLVSQKIVSFTVAPNGRDMTYLAGLVQEGRIAPVIDRTYPLAEIPDAIAYLEEGHARGKVVIDAGAQ